MDAINTKRIEYIDLAKGVCIILVVLYHTLNDFGIHDYFAADAMRDFRMPLYFFLSGLFFKPYEGYMGFLKRKINKLLIPFLAFYFITVVCYEYISGVFHGTSLPDIGLAPLYDCYIEVWHFNTPLWFLLCLFVLNNIILYIISYC